MGRTAKYTADQVLDKARGLLVDRGPAGVSVQGIAAALRAPSGSVYYRFASRDLLMASLWLRSVERFQAGLFGLLDDSDAYRIARRSAAYVLTWSRAFVDDARLLMVYRSGDLLDSGWPAELVERNAEQLARIESYLVELGRRLGAASPAGMRRIRFAVLDIPYAAVREPLLRGEAPASELDALVDAAVTAVLAPLITGGEHSCP
jgi:AcrR family transcriptional regulator